MRQRESSTLTLVLVISIFMDSEAFWHDFLLLLLFIGKILCADYID